MDNPPERDWKILRDGFNVYMDKVHDKSLALIRGIVGDNSLKSGDKICKIDTVITDKYSELRRCVPVLKRSQFYLIMLYFARENVLGDSVEKFTEDTRLRLESLIKSLE